MLPHTGPKNADKRTLVVLALFVIACAFVGYGLWLLATPDYQGGRNAAGLLFVAGAVVFAFASAVLFVRRRVR